jgi:hypothetical protein
MIGAIGELPVSHSGGERNHRAYEDTGIPVDALERQRHGEHAQNARLVNTTWAQNGHRMGTERAQILRRKWASLRKPFI